MAALPALLSGVPRGAGDLLPCKLVKSVSYADVQRLPKDAVSPVEIPDYLRVCSARIQDDRVPAAGCRDPISTWATQWFTPTSGTLSASARDRAAVPLSAGTAPARPLREANPRRPSCSSRTVEMTSFITDAWCRAASRG